ncbi:homeobox domain-containing protein [Irpex rosettiformis]|uniref:Homeobox domain-containing protein n=1 Tax=Irpex rosettiformis TaxID=378272 RepID=A0ACB8UL77_9APHY|nr:homeobox domain-containing protein [Irpex rosettiformis]
MRPATRTTRATRVTNVEELDIVPFSQSAASCRSSRTGTPASDRGKKPRHRMTDKQLERLEALYQEDTHPTRERKQALGDDVGMDTRTVTVWFQNRRQLAKKQSSIVNSTQPMSRQPLSAVPQHANKHSRQSSVSSFSQLSFSDRVTPQPYSVSRQVKRELWEYLPSTPPSLPTSAATSAMPSPLSKKFKRSLEVYPELDKENANRKRKPVLEWACARMVKRQRLQPTENIDDCGDETEDEDLEDTLIDIEADLAGDTIGKPKFNQGSRTTDSGSLEAVVIPPEYKAKFDDDIIFGASLLLTFTYAFRSKS